MTFKTLKSFATGMRAFSLCTDLQDVGISAQIFKPKYVNKRLPPPKVEVQVDEAQWALAIQVLDTFNKIG